MKKINVKIVNAFSLNGNGGNPAGVVFDADQFSNYEKQIIAKKVGLSETAFVSESKIAEYKLDFFTPAKQIAHCGHATIAVFSLLKKLDIIKGNRSSKETIDGIREIYFDGDEAYMEQRSPIFKTIENKDEVLLETLDLTNSDLLENVQPMIVDTGNAFLIVPLKNEITIKSLRYKQNAIRKVSKKHGLIGLYVFTIPEEEIFDATARMFAPYYGIEEEAATGMAAGPLSSYFYKYILKKKSFLFKQGEFMPIPSPSLIKSNLNILNNKIEKLFVGGSAYVNEEKLIEI